MSISSRGVTRYALSGWLVTLAAAHRIDLPTFFNWLAISCSLIGNLPGLFLCPDSCRIKAFHNAVFKE